MSERSVSPGTGVGAASLRSNELEADFEPRMQHFFEDARGLSRARHRAAVKRAEPDAAQRLGDRRGLPLTERREPAGLEIVLPVPNQDQLAHRLTR